jgi:hypothetical protein
MTKKGRALMLAGVAAAVAASAGVAFTQARAQGPAVMVYKTPT